MKDAILRANLIVFSMLVLVTVCAAAQQPAEDLSGYLPEEGEVAGWKLSEDPKNYCGDDLFLMIDGGADIYHEYGFRQVLRAEYLDVNEKSIKLEIYQMKSPASAYGIYSFKVGEGGKPLTIGHEARLQDYYLNFWKGDLLVTVIGLDSDAETVQAVVALAKAVDVRISYSGKRPDLAEALLDASLGFSDAKYVRGPLGVMGSYVFDTENFFQVREGVIGRIGKCQAFVFRYADVEKGADVFTKAVKGFEASSQFTGQSLQEGRYTMIDRDKALVTIGRTGRYIAVVIGQDRDEGASVLNRLLTKLAVLKDKLSYPFSDVFNRSRTSCIPRGNCFPRVQDITNLKKLFAVCGSS